MNIGLLYEKLKKARNVYEAFEIPIFRQACLKYMSDAQFTSEALFFFARLEVGNLKNCKATDLALVFLEVVSNGLSFSSAKEMVYLFTRAVKGKDKDGKDVVIGYNPDLRYSPLGKMMLKPDITHEQPVIVFDCDRYSITNTSSGVKMEHTPANPRPQSAKVVGGFIRLFRNGQPALFTYTLHDFESWRKKSSAPNSQAWGFGKLEEAVPMLKSKVLSHAYHSLPNTKAQSQNTVQEQETEEDVLEPLRMEYEKIIAVMDSGAYLPFADLIAKKDIDLYAYIETAKETVEKHYTWLVAQIAQHEPNIKMPDFKALLEGDKFVEFVRKSQAKVSSYPNEEAGVV